MVVVAYLDMYSYTQHMYLKKTVLFDFFESFERLKFDTHRFTYQD